MQDGGEPCRSRMREAIRATLLGGVVFIIPLVCVVVLVGKAFQIMKTIGTPLSRIMPVETLAGVAFVEIVTALLLFGCCLAAGLAARSQRGQILHRKLDEVLMNLLPGYAWVKGMTGDISDQDARQTFQAVLVQFDDQYQVGYMVDQINSDVVVVYLPGAPDARAGAITLVAAERLRSLDLDFGTVARLCKKLGQGAGELLGDVKFQKPA